MPERLLLNILVLLGLLMGASAAIAAPVEQSIQYAGAKRHYVVSLPPGYPGRTQCPLILVFHGGGGNPEQVLKSTDIADRAAREGWILVAPGGSGGSEVVQVVLLNQGHAWPGGSKGYRQGDEPTQPVSANALMFEFFKRHPKRR